AGLEVDTYIWKERGGKGKTFTSLTSFPITDLRSTMGTRYYVATDVGKNKFFVKEFFYSWLSPNRNYELAVGEYKRGRKVSENLEISDYVVCPLALYRNFLIFPYFDMADIRTINNETGAVPVKDNIIKIIFGTAVGIYDKIGPFDFNANNILYNYDTEEIKFIDFEPVTAAFTDALFRDRFKQIAYQYSHICPIGSIEEIREGKGFVMEEDNANG
ncbi:unnamed protein product, partial [marine sediment metagenome]